MKFITDKENPEEIDVYLDEEGIDTFIWYLEGLKRDKDHFHLMPGTELDETVIPDNFKGRVFNVKMVNVYYEKDTSSEEITNS